MIQRSWVALSFATALSAALLAGGCASHKNKNPDAKGVPMDRGVTDIAPTKHAAPTRAVPPDPSFVSVPASAAQPKFVPVDTPAVDASSMISATPAPAALPPAPVAPAPAITQTPPAAPAVAPASAPVASTAAPAAGGARQYKVQKGDTLFHIAKAHYGDGNRWQQIASANAGLTPATLKAGTTIVVP